MVGNSHTLSQLAQKLRASTLEEQVLLLSPFVLPHSPVVCTLPVTSSSYFWIAANGAAGPFYK